MDFIGITNIDYDQSTITATVEMYLQWTDERLNVTNSVQNGTRILEWFKIGEALEAILWTPPIGFQSIRQMKNVGG